MHDPSVCFFYPATRRAHTTILRGFSVISLPAGGKSCIHIFFHDSPRPGAGADTFCLAGRTEKKTGACGTSSGLLKNEED
jgi:hypothetical protein